MNKFNNLIVGSGISALLFIKIVQKNLKYLQATKIKY